MKLLTATSATQGFRANDFDYTVEGELVHLGVICGRDEREGPDGGCGCGRAFAGLNSHLATTTSMVRDIDGLTFEDLTLAVMSYLEQSGWAELVDGSLPQVRREAEGEAHELAQIAARYPAGAILEHRGGDVISPREVPS